MTASRSRGAHRCDGHGSVADSHLADSHLTDSHPADSHLADSHLHPATLARVHRTRRPGPGPAPARPRPTHARPEGLLSGSALRTWIDERPFLAGLCLMVAGIEIGFWPVAPLSTGPGVSGLMFMVLLVADGLAVWLVPLYCKPLGVQAVALGLLGLTTANVGGLFLGTCAAVTGGALAFCWTRGELSAAHPARGARQAGMRPAAVERLRL